VRLYRLSLKIILLLGIATWLADCGGGGNGSGRNCVAGGVNAGITTLELMDPTPCERDRFGYTIVTLSNGNVVVSDPFDSSVAYRSGAIHLYDPETQKLIKSIYGESKDDSLGFGDYFYDDSSGSFALNDGFIVALPNDNFVIASPYAEENGLSDNGSVILVDGETGDQIGEKIVGSVGFQMSYGGVKALTNSNFVISSVFADENGLSDNGLVILVDGQTGKQIGDTISGDNDRDSLGDGGIVALSNGNFVISSWNDDVAGNIDAGSIILVNGLTGIPIGNAITGNDARDQMGVPINVRSQYSVPPVKDLGNGNYVIVTPNDDEEGVSNVGSVILVDASSGLQIGNKIVGDDEGDRLGNGDVLVLSNGNFVISSYSDDHNGVEDAGTVRLIDGAPGILIGSIISGDTHHDKISAGGVVALANNNYVVVSPHDDEGGLVNIGTVMLFDGTTGSQIGSKIVLNNIVDPFHTPHTFITALENNNFVIRSPGDDVDGKVDTGSIKLIDGSTGLQIGDVIAGDTEEQLGRDIAALANSNFVVTSPSYGEDSKGSVVLVNGSDGSQIGEPIRGDDKSDRLGLGGVFALDNNRYLILSPYDDNLGVRYAGSVKLVSGETGIQIGDTIFGNYTGDMVYPATDFLSRPVVFDLENSDFALLGLSKVDKNGLRDSGFVGLIQKNNR